MNQEIKVKTLCLITQADQILLGMKKRGFGEGKWNGFGGKVEAGESIEDSVVRETLEESGLRVSDLEPIGILEFTSPNWPEIIQMHIFKTSTFEGEPSESEEMRPQWFHVREVPMDQMWTSDVMWYPLFLDGKRFKGHFRFDADNEVVEHYLEEVETLT